MNSLELDRFSVSICGKTILADVSFALPTGGFLVVVGPNGAGKTTLLRALLGAIPGSGQARVLEVLLGQFDSSALTGLRRRIAYLPQVVGYGTLTPLTVAQVVESGRTHGWGFGWHVPPEDAAMCHKWIARLGLEPLAERPFHRLSGGEQRKTLLARAFAREPQLILLDEPSGHLDFLWQETLDELIGQLWLETRTTVVMVTHDLRRIPDRDVHVLLLAPGQSSRFGPPEQVLESRTLSAAYRQPLEVCRTHGRWMVLPSRSN